jgi:hypothetical protein
MDKASALQDAIQDGGRQVLIVQNLSPLAEWLIGGKDQRSLSQVSVVDHVKQNIGSIRTVG